MFPPSDQYVPQFPEEQRAAAEEFGRFAMARAAKALDRGT